MRAKKYVVVLIVAFIVLIATLGALCFLIESPVQVEMDNIMSAKSIIIMDRTYSIEDIERIEEIGNIYDKKYKIVLKNGGEIYFDEYILEK